MRARWIHGMKVLVGCFVVALLVVGMLAQAADSEKGFKPIFDGKTLDGWDGNPKFWSVQDGAITGQTTKENPTESNTFIFWTQGKPADFELRFQFRIESGNSGVQYRSFKLEKGDKWACGGYQYDMDAASQWTGGVYGEQYRGILSIRGQKVTVGDDHKPKVTGKIGDRDELKKLVKEGQWNDGSIIAQGNHFVLTLNDKVTCEMVDDDQEMRRQDGLIALQLHRGPPMKVQFRNIRLKTLKAKGASTN